MEKAAWRRLYNDGLVRRLHEECPGMMVPTHEWGK
jgi:hypothetical protein